MPTWDCESACQKGLWWCHWQNWHLVLNSFWPFRNLWSPKLMCRLLFYFFSHFKLSKNICSHSSFFYFQRKKKFFSFSLFSFSLIITIIFLVWERFEKINKSHMITFSSKVTSQITYCNIQFSHLSERAIIWTQILLNKNVIKPQLTGMRPSKLWGLHKSIFIQMSFGSYPNYIGSFL